MVHGGLMAACEMVSLHSGRLRQVDQPDLIRRGLPGEEPPHIDRQLTGDGHDGFDASLLPRGQASCLRFASATSGSHWSVLTRRRTTARINIEGRLSIELRPDPVPVEILISRVSGAQNSD